jgi:hypothetical protein
MEPTEPPIELPCAWFDSGCGGVTARRLALDVRDGRPDAHAQPVMAPAGGIVPLSDRFPTGCAMLLSLDRSMDGTNSDPAIKHEKGAASRRRAGAVGAYRSRRTVLANRMCAGEMCSNN